jgi:hypothetical protein
MIGWGGGAERESQLEGGIGIVLRRREGGSEGPLVIRSGSVFQFVVRRMKGF